VRYSVPTAAVGLVPCGALKTAVTDIMRRKGDAIYAPNHSPQYTAAKRDLYLSGRSGAHPD
jgi:hypothetical protein